jgi:HEAT repeat protein
MPQAIARQALRRRLPGLILWGMVLMAFCGCANFWDDVTSHGFRMKDLWTKEDPLVVLRDSNDGARRAKALANLAEPSQQGGKPDEQELYIKILTKSASEDRDPLCRMGAIHALANYKDPRAARVLEDVYQQRLPFTSELNTIVRQQALAAVVQTGNPDSRALLIRVARSPSGPVESSLTDRQQTQDERLTAIRGLAKFSQPDAIETLVYIMESEKDVALHDRAHESLKQVTGKNIPDDAKAWRAYAQNPQSAPPEPSFIQRVMFWNKNDK